MFFQFLLSVSGSSTKFEFLFYRLVLGIQKKIWNDGNFIGIEKLSYYKDCFWIFFIAYVRLRYVTLFITTVSVITIKDKNRKGYDIKTNNLNFHKLPCFLKLQLSIMTLNKIPLSFRVRNNYRFLIYSSMLSGKLFKLIWLQ